MCFGSNERGSFDPLVGHGLKSLVFVHLAGRLDVRALTSSPILYRALPFVMH
jgi:hypothetical protein